MDGLRVAGAAEEEGVWTEGEAEDGGTPGEDNQCWQSAPLSQPIIGLGEPVDDRLDNRFMERHVLNFRTRTAGQGRDSGRHSIRDVDQNL